MLDTEREEFARMLNCDEDDIPEVVTVNYDRIKRMQDSVSAGHMPVGLKAIIAYFSLHSIGMEPQETDEAKPEDIPEAKKKGKGGKPKPCVTVPAASDDELI